MTPETIPSFEQLEKTIDRQVNEMLGRNAIEVVVESRVRVSQEEKVSAALAVNLVLGKLLTDDQRRVPLRILYGGKMEQEGKELTHPAEAFSDGETIAFAMYAENMKNWRESLGEIATALLHAAHEAMHIAQIRMGDAPPGSYELIRFSGVDSYENDPYEVAAWNEALDLFKALRPHVQGVLTIGNRKYEVPKSSSYVLDLQKIPDYIKGLESMQYAGKELKLAIVKLGEDVPDQIIEAVKRAVLETLKTLEVSLEKFTVFDPAELIDLDKKDANNLHTFERLPGSDLQIPVIIVSSRPLYDFRGRETIALYEPDNAKIFLNLRRIQEAVIGQKIDDETATAIVAIEETVHFIQDKYWNRESAGGSIDFQEIEMAAEHDANPIEAEANRLKKLVYDRLYPELNIKVRGIDY